MSQLMDWWGQFQQVVEDPDRAEPLREASLAGRLNDWTTLATDAVVRSCGALGWEVAARGHKLDRLPVPASEYLVLDAMAFPARSDSSAHWPLPLAVFELENCQTNDRIAYSLWKVLCVRTQFRVVFAYRNSWEQVRSLIEHLTTDVASALRPAEREAIKGETAVVTGNRDEGDTFPYGYFKLWRLDINLGKFDRV